ncbi:MAG: M20/M25/M40 family metallo-hydrolase [Woeseiaceae bacterium]|nr:M20/M25/M40 family metallo-hydrolase [Woeseiaceae bacterium]
MIYKYKFTSILVFFAAFWLSSARAEPADVAAIRDVVESHRANAILLYREFLSLPNDALNPSDIEKLVTWMEAEFAERGFTTSRLLTAGSPSLIANRHVADDKPTVLIYLQADGQPVDPTAWQQASPYLAVLKEWQADSGWAEIPWERLELGTDMDWRIFARSAADSKGPMTQFLLAIELLDQLNFTPDYNLKVLVDTEEELGSPNIADAIIRNRDRLAADLLLIFDGPPHASNRPTVTFGARGIATLTLTTYGPIVAQHSGHYGNFLPNPAFRLSALLASMKSPEGRVLIPGFYDGIELDAKTREILARVPDDEDAILAASGVAEPEAVGDSLQESLQFPSLNVRGMAAGWVGDEARTIIPPTATAEIDIRLVTESDPERLLGLVRSHVENQGFHVLDRAPTPAERAEFPRIASMTTTVSYGAFRSSFDALAGLMARQGMVHLYGEEPILIRSMGGSIPIAPIIDALNIPAATVPTVNMDNNQHSPNENLRLGNFFEGIAILMSVLSQPVPVASDSISSAD